MSKLFQTCSELEAHKAANNGGFDLKWFEAHVKICSICRPIQEAFTRHVKHEFENVTRIGAKARR